MPSFDKETVESLLETDLVTDPTRKVIQSRLADRSGSQNLLASVIAQLLGENSDPSAATIAAKIEQRLDNGDSNGWRYDALPPDPEAYRQGLSWLADRGYETLDNEAQHWLLEEARSSLPLFFEELLAEVAEWYYSHPRAWEEIGYLGFADGHGWRSIGLDEHEDFGGNQRQQAASLDRRPMRSFSTEECVDAVVIGTGAGGAPLLSRLAEAGLKVVALEAGPWWNPAKDFATDELSQSKLFWNDERLSAGDTPLSFGRNNSGTGVGGSTLHYTAFTPRPQPDDFGIYSEFGVGADWPIGYCDLEPYFDELELFLGVSGPTPYPWGPPRNAGYPLKPLPLNSAAQLMERGCRLLGIKTSHAANAALSAPRNTLGVGWRPACTNRGFCQAGCSTGAKASMDVTFIPRAISAGAEIRPDSFVTQILMDGQRRVEAVEYRRGGRSQRQRCRAVFLCAGPLKALASSC